MKFGLAALTLLVSAADAFPQGLLDGVNSLLPSQLLQLQSLRDQALRSIQNGEGGNTLTNSFSPGLQLVRTDGIHEWRAPQPGDRRGPCPGLNALANHGYIPRNGFATIPQFVAGTGAVFGMSPELATVLAAYGAVFSGPLIGWQIGGINGEGPGRGIGASHGHYETDNSPMRGDLNQYGSNTAVIVSQFQRLFDLQPDPETANYDINVLSEFRNIRWFESIEKNPLFYYGPFVGTAVSQAAHSFIPRFMSNHSSEFPNGILNQEVLKSFFSITGESGNFEWVPGHERIPNNWYRRPLTSPYGVRGLGDDTRLFAETTPQILQPACNQGEVNTLVEVNVFNDDGSSYDFSNPIHSVCFAAGLIGAGIRDASPVLVIGADLVALLLTPIFGALGCPQVPELSQTVKETCPGYSFFGGPNGPVAPGAIQD